MKVTQTALNYHPSVGGHQLFVQHVAEGIVERHGDDVEVVTTDSLRNPASDDPGRIPERSAVIGGVRVRRFPVAQRTQRLLRRWRALAIRLHLPTGDPDARGPLVSGPVSARMALALLRTDADVVCGTPFDYLTVYYALAAARLRRRPVAVFGSLHLDSGMLPRRVVRAARRADAYIAHTGFERDTLVARGVDPEGIAVVPAGVDPTPFETADGRELRRRHGFGDDPVVGFIGRQAPYKGLPLLLDAMERVWDEHPTARLLIAGSPTTWSPVLRARIDDLPSERRARVLLVDDFPAADKPGLYAAADLVVTVSKAEAFGIVYLEAWAASRPVVGARTAAVADVIRDGVDGFQVDPDDPGELADAIGKLVVDPDRRAAMGRAGQERVAREFTWDVVADAWHDALALAVERHRTHARRRDSWQHGPPAQSRSTTGMTSAKDKAAATVKRTLQRTGITVTRTARNDQLRARARKGNLYPIAIRELEAVWRNTRFTDLPEREGRVELLAELDGTQPTEAMHLLAWLHESLGVDGAIGEMGCAAGLTSALIGNELLDTDRHFWIFDSFEGLSAPTEKDQLIDDVFGLGSMDAYAGTFAFAEASVRSNLAGVGFPADRTHTVKGFIPASFERPGLPERFAFVYVDLDLYQPIKDALVWLHDRVPAGGIVMVDDYGWFSAGAQAAVDEFLADHPDDYEVRTPESWEGHFIGLKRRG